MEGLDALAEMAAEDDSLLKKPIPVTIITGFLGVGKSTLVKHILENTKLLKFGVIINDVAAVNIDAKLIKRMDNDNAKTVELQNGCACCSASDGLFKSIRKLLKLGSFDHILVECSGVTNPKRLWALLDSILEEEELGDEIKLSKCVTIVDLSHFFKMFNSKNKTIGADSERYVSDLLVEQIESGDVILANKVDLVSPAEIDQSVLMLQEINAKCTVIKTQNSIVALDLLTSESQGASNASLNVEEEHRVAFTATTSQPKRAKVGPNVESFVYKRRKPFDPKKFEKVMLNSEVPTCLKKVLRSKGYVWMINHPGALYWSQAGPHKSLTPLGLWWIDVPEADRPTGLEDFSEIVGDRRQELIYIGIDIHPQDIEEKLDSCLVSDEDFETLRKRLLEES